MIEVGLNEMPAIPPGFAVVIPRSSSTDATPVALARTRTDVVVSWQLVLAEIVTLPLFPLPGWLKLAVTPLGRESGIDNVTEPVKPLARVIETLTVLLLPGLTVIDVGLTETFVMPGG